MAVKRGEMRQPITTLKNAKVFDTGLKRPADGCHHIWRVWPGGYARCTKCAGEQIRPQKDYV